MVNLGKSITRFRYIICSLLLVKLEFIGESIYISTVSEKLFVLRDIGIPYVEVSKVNKDREDITDVANTMQEIGIYSSLCVFVHPFCRVS